MIQSNTMIDKLANDKSAFQEIDMGKYEEEDRQYMFIDIQTKKLYDMRNENHLLKLQDQ